MFLLLVEDPARCLFGLPVVDLHDVLASDLHGQLFLDSVCVLPHQLFLVGLVVHSGSLDRRLVGGHAVETHQAVVATRSDLQRAHSAGLDQFGAEVCAVDLRRMHQAGPLYDFLGVVMRGELRVHARGTAVGAEQLHGHVARGSDDEFVVLRPLEVMDDALVRYDAVLEPPVEEVLDAQFTLFDGDAIDNGDGRHTVGDELAHVTEADDVAPLVAGLDLQQNLVWFAAVHLARWHASPELFDVT